MSIGPLLGVGIGYSVTAPEVVTLATRLVFSEANQRFPSGPAAMPKGRLPGVGTGYSVMVPTALLGPAATVLTSEVAAGGQGIRILVAEQLDKPRVTTTNPPDASSAPGQALEPMPIDRNDVMTFGLPPE